MTFKKLKHILLTIINPSSWCGYQASEDIDKAINEIMDKGVLSKYNNYIITYEINNNIIEVWVENYPHSSGHIYRVNGKRFDRKETCFLQTRYKLEKKHKGLVKAQQDKQTIFTN